MNEVNELFLVSQSPHHQIGRPAHRKDEDFSSIARTIQAFVST